MSALQLLRVVQSSHFFPYTTLFRSVTRGAGFQFAQAEELTRSWRAEAAEKGQSILEFAREKSGSRRGSFTGSYDAVADRLLEFARLGAIDGLNITDRRSTRLNSSHVAISS